MARLRPSTLNLAVRNDLSEIRRIASRVEEFCAQNNLGDEVAHAVNLCLDELLANTISYGYDDEASHEIRVDIEASKERVQIIVSDDARPFDPTLAGDPDTDAELDDRPIGGLGIHFVRAMMDEVHYSHVDGQNRLTLIKRTGM